MPTNLYQRTAMAAAIAACFPGAALGAGAARVDFAIGNVTAVGPDGKSRPLTRGSEIQVGDTVNTQQGRAQLRFEDGAYMSLQPETAFKIEQFHFAGQEDGKENIVMNLLKGGMRTITGLIGRTNRSNYKLRTEVATIGIRGTEFSVRYINSIEFFCAGGSIEVQNQGTPTPVVFNAGQGGIVKDQQTQPQQTTERPFLAPTAAGGGSEEEEQQASNEPTNPLQGANPAVTEEKAKAQLPTLLTGTLTGSGAITTQSFTAQSTPGFPFAVENQTGVFDSAGKLISFTNPDLTSFEGPSAGTNTFSAANVVSQGNDGIIAWGRWVNATIGGTNGLSGTNLGSITEGALHYVVGLPATSLPTSGTATYSMIGASTPSFGSSFSSASVNASAIHVDFATTSASFYLKMTVSGQNVETIGSAASGGISITRNGTLLSGSASSSGFSSMGPFCSPNLRVAGFLSGSGASRAGMAYVISESTSSTVNGTIAYKK